MSTEQNGQKAGTPSPERPGSQKDELYEQAKAIVVEHQRAGLHLLQSHLRIGYMRAAMLLDELERQGVVGPFDGNEPRKVLCANAGAVPRRGSDVGTSPLLAVYESGKA